MLNHKKLNFWIVAQNVPQCWCKIAKASFTQGQYLLGPICPKSGLGIKENYRHDNIGPVQES